MQRENPIDRAMRALRGVFIWGLILSGPIFLMTYGWAMKLLINAAPWWVSVPTVIAHLATLLAIGSLIDIRQERLNSPQDGQHAQPQRK